jgi:hypothetical protein
MDPYLLLPHSLGVAGNRKTLYPKQHVCTDIACTQLEVSKCQLPEGVWQHVFPAGRQLPHLQSLAISDVSLPSGDQASAPEGSRLVTCCPGLRCLDIRQLQYSTDLLAPLQQLTGLGTLL